MEGGGPVSVLCSQPMTREDVAVEMVSFSHNFRRASALAIASAVRGTMNDSILLYPDFSALSMVYLKVY